MTAACCHRLKQSIFEENKAREVVPFPSIHVSSNFVVIYCCSLFEGNRSSIQSRVSSDSRSEVWKDADLEMGTNVLNKHCRPSIHAGKGKHISFG